MSATATKFVPEFGNREHIERVRAEVRAAELAKRHATHAEFVEDCPKCVAGAGPQDCMCGDPFCEDCTGTRVA